MIEGPIALSTALDELRRVATRIGRRYMGVERADEFGARNAVEGELLVRLRPAHVLAEAELADEGRTNERDLHSCSDPDWTDPRPRLVAGRRQRATAPHSRGAGVRRRFAPHQLGHAHAVEMAHEGVPLIVIQGQLGHTNLGITSVYLQGIDNAEIIQT